ncbi:hypothetical protein RR48_15129 [Papilio machaon]|uniref:Uncharacterized protein n=1 Tax=Papilio machaon TaxID=76193 RepID=A0A194QTY0_PAPMA|nr:hypothetical protein RR48_15129 [Papilio machaon]
MVGGFTHPSGRAASAASADGAAEECESVPVAPSPMRRRNRGGLAEDVWLQTKSGIEKSSRGPGALLLTRILLLNRQDIKENGTDITVKRSDVYVLRHLGQSEARRE